MVANIVKLFEDDELRKKIADNGIKTGKERSLEKSAKEFEKILVEEIGKEIESRYYNATFCA